jgi:hypothetical protein
MRAKTLADPVDWSRFTVSDDARDEFCARILERLTLDAIRHVVGHGRTVSQAVAHEVDRVPAAMVRDGAPTELVLFVAELLRRGRPTISRRVAELIEVAASHRASRRDAPRSSRPLKAGLPVVP